MPRYFGADFAAFLFSRRKQMNSLLELIRGIVRPTLAISAWLATIAFLVMGVSIPDAWWSTVATLTTFYFVQRHEEKRNQH